MGDKIANFIGKLMIIPFLYFVMYTYSIVISERVLNYIGYSTNNLYGFIACIVLSSVVAFVVTFIIHTISAIIWSGSVFIKWFKFTNIIYLYLSGIASAIDVMQPLLIKEGILTREYNVTYKMAFLMFFIALFNYTFYESIIISKNINFDEFRLVKGIKRIPSNVRNIWKYKRNF